MYPHPSRRTTYPGKPARPATLFLMLIEWNSGAPPGRVTFAKVILTTALADLKTLREECMDLPLEHRGDIILGDLPLSYARSERFPFIGF